MASKAKTASAAKTANDALRDSVLLHAHAIEKFKAGEIKKILYLLNHDAYPAIVLELEERLNAIKERGYDKGLETTARLRDLRAALAQLIEDASKMAKASLSKSLNQYGTVEAQIAAKQIGKAMPKSVKASIGVEVIVPSPETLRALANTKPLSGSTLEEHFTDLSKASQRKIERALNVGLVAGETTEQIVSRIAGSNGVLSKTRRHVKSIVGSAVQHVGMVARSATYAENDDIIKAETWMSTLDDRTCEECGALDGTEFELGEGEQPPAHLNCRCVRLPVLKSWRELGIDADDISESTRASMDGQVPESMTYNEWIKGQPEHVQNEALGPGAADLLRNNDLSMSDFVDQNGERMTLDDIREAHNIPAPDGEEQEAKSEPELDAPIVASDEPVAVREADVEDRVRVAEQEAAAEATKAAEAAAQAKQAAAQAKIDALEAELVAQKKVQEIELAAAKKAAEAARKKAEKEAAEKIAAIEAKAAQEVADANATTMQASQFTGREFDIAGDTMDRLPAGLDTEIGKWRENLSKEQGAALLRWRRLNYDQIAAVDAGRSTTFAGEAIDATKRESAVRWRDDLYSSLKLAPKVNATLYRGMVLTEVQIAEVFKVGSVIKSDAIASWTADKYVVSVYSEVSSSVAASQGVELVARNGKGFAAFLDKGEHEVLVVRGSSMRVLSKQLVGGVWKVEVEFL